MSAAWRCHLCGRGDDRNAGNVCECVTVRHCDWMLLRKLWSGIRSLAARADPEGSI